MSPQSITSRAVILVALVALAGVAFGGVAVADTTTHATVTDAAANTQNQTNQTAYLRVIHASPDAPNVDVYLDNETVLTDVPFGTVSDYLEVAPGEHTVAITVAGNQSAEVFGGNVTLNAGGRYTIAATGEVTEGAPTTFQAFILQDTVIASASGNASISLVHLSPDAPAVDATTDDTVLFDNVSFRNASNYVTVPAGNYTVDVRGATADNNGSVVTSFDVSLESGTAYTAFAVGYLDPANATGNVTNASFDLLVATDIGPENATMLGNVTTTETNVTAGNETANATVGA